MMQPDRDRHPIPAKTALLSAVDTFCSRLANERHGENGFEPFIQQLAETLKSDKLIRVAGQTAGSDDGPDLANQANVEVFRDLLQIGPQDCLQKKRSSTTF